MTTATFWENQQSGSHRQPTSPGLGNTNTYLVAGNPWLTGSGITGSAANNGEVYVDFPRVPRSFTIINTSSGSSAGGNEIIVHLASRTDPNVITYRHFITLGRQSSYGFDIRCKRVYLSSKAGDVCEWEMHAELTGIRADEMFNVTGSGIDSAD